MESRIARELKLAYPPVALRWSAEKPEGAMQFTEGKWGCVMWLVASAAKGRPAVCDRKTVGCVGGGVGVGKGTSNGTLPGARNASVASCPRAMMPGSRAGSGESKALPEERGMR